MSYSGKVVIVTGASSGIGACTAISFAKEHAKVVIVGRNETKLNNVADQIANIGTKPLVIKADVCEIEDLKNIIKKTIDTYGKLDVLVNNAGMVKLATILDKNLSEVFDLTMNTNLKSAVLLTSLAAPYLIETKGNIVNISSVAGTSQLAALGVGYLSYCTSKAGLDHFSRLTALELAEKGVRVNLVSPGPVDTPIIGKVDMSPIVDKTALKLLIRPEEVADMILYLASDQARCITGSTFVIDSGLKLSM